MDVINPHQLEAHEFFRGIQPGYLDLLATTARFVEIPAGYRFFQEGCKADRFWAIQSGQVGLDLLVPGRGHVVVETLGRGTMLGWSWLFPPRIWRFGAVATMPIKALEFDAELVLTRCSDNPALGYELTTRFTELILERLQATRFRLLDVYAHPAETP
jgi:CRP/FNR family cyclic AMP-dependent transcriptional regulator